MGGIDVILNRICGSDIKLTPNEVDAIAQIIENPNRISYRIMAINDEDQASADSDVLCLRFKDENTFLFQQCGRERAQKILNAINSRYIKGSFVIIWVILAILGVLGQHTLHDDLDTFWSISLSIYILFWMSFANKLAMKQLMQSFVCIFKLMFLFMFISAFIAIGYYNRDSRPFYDVCAASMLWGVCVFFVLILDAINLRKENKVFMSCLTAGFLVGMTMFYRKCAWYPDECPLFKEATLTISDPFGMGTFKVPFVEMAANSAQNLSLFLLNQVYGAMFHPERAMVIKTAPKIQFDRKEGNALNNSKGLKLLRFGIISFGIILILFWFIVEIPSFPWDEDKSALYMNILYSYCVINSALMIAASGLFMMNKVSMIRISMILLVTGGVIQCLAIFFLDADPFSIFIYLIGISCVYIYSVRVCCPSFVYIMYLYIECVNVYIEAVCIEWT